MLNLVAKPCSVKIFIEAPFPQNSIRINSCILQITTVLHNKTNRCRIHEIAISAFFNSCFQISSIVVIILAGLDTISISSPPPPGQKLHETHLFHSRLCRTHCTHNVKSWFLNRILKSLSFHWISFLAILFWKCC